MPATPVTCVSMLDARGQEIRTALTTLAARSDVPVKLLIDAVGEHQPDVTVVDVRMPPGYTDEGLRAAIAIRRDHPKTGVLVFSQYIETRYAADLPPDPLTLMGIPSISPGCRAVATLAPHHCPRHFWPYGGSRLGRYGFLRALCPARVLAQDYLRRILLT